MKTFNAQLLAAVALAQCNEKTCYYLCGVFLHDNIAVATDGHILTIAEYDVDNGDGGIYPVSKKAITALKGRHAHIAVFDNELLTVLDENNEPLHIEPSKPIDGTFPDYQRVIPEDSHTSCAAVITAINMRKITDTAQIFDNSTPIRITGENASSPQTVKYHINHNIKTIVMPTKV